MRFRPKATSSAMRSRQRSRFRPEHFRISLQELDALRVTKSPLAPSRSATGRKYRANWGHVLHEARFVAG
jgi:hypothetical protein